jgi:branched-chain amino acid transport system permease protein
MITLTEFEYFLQQAINAISIGSLYALMAIGLAMVYGILRLINFAHGDLIMVGSYATLFLSFAGFPFWAAAIGGIAIAGVAGLIMERVAYRPIRGAPDVSMLLTSFAVTIFLENVAILFFSPSSRPFPAPDFLNSALNFGALRVNSVDIIAIVVTGILLVLLTLFAHITITGHQYQPGFCQCFRNRSFISWCRWSFVECADRENRSADGVLSCIESFRSFGDRRPW